MRFAERTLRRALKGLRQPVVLLASMFLVASPLFAQFPIISSTTIAYGVPSAGLNQITINGTTFGPSHIPVVTLNGTTLPIVSWSTTKITANFSSSLPPGNYILTVKNFPSFLGSSTVTVGNAGPQGIPGVAGPNGSPTLTIGIVSGFITATSANVNTTGRNTSHVGGGGAVTVSFDWTNNRNGYCPGCFEQIVGALVNADTTVIAGSITGGSCLDFISDNSGGNSTMTFTAPGTVGTYYIALYPTLDFGCGPVGTPGDGWVLDGPFPANLPQSDFLAGITVY